MEIDDSGDFSSKDIHTLQARLVSDTGEEAGKQSLIYFVVRQNVLLKYTFVCD